MCGPFLLLSAQQLNKAGPAPRTLAKTYRPRLEGRGPSPARRSYRTGSRRPEPRRSCTTQRRRTADREHRPAFNYYRLDRPQPGDYAQRAKVNCLLGCAPRPNRQTPQNKGRGPRISGQKSRFLAENPRKIDRGPAASYRRLGPCFSQILQRYLLRVLTVVY